MFFLGFIFLFCMVFALGVIVGKGLETEDLFHIGKKEKDDKLLASSSVTIIDKTEEKKQPEPEIKKEVKPAVKTVEKKPAPAKKKTSDEMGGQGKYQIYVRTIKGVRFPINAIPSNKISQVKKKIHQKKGIPIEDQMLSFKDVPLKDEKTVCKSQYCDDANRHSFLHPCP